MKRLRQGTVCSKRRRRTRNGGRGVLGSSGKTAVAHTLANKPVYDHAALRLSTLDTH